MSEGVLACVDGALLRRAEGLGAGFSILWTKLVFSNWSSCRVY